MNTNSSALLKYYSDVQAMYEFIYKTITTIVTDAVEAVFAKMITEGKLILPSDNEKQFEELWTIDQFCSFVHVSKPTYHSFVHRKLIHPRKCGHRTLISRAEVLEMIESGRLGRYKR